MKEDLEEYIRYLQIERGLADNTIESYKRDLNQYLVYLEKNELRDREKIDRYTILSFMQELKETKKSSATVIRMVSSLRKFHQYLKQEQRSSVDPMLHIDTPKKAHHLPKVLSMTEVEKLIETPNTNEILGLRDRAILEVMYATGLRVT